MPTLYESLKRNENINVNALYFENKSYTFKEVVKNVEKMITYLKKFKYGKLFIIYSLLLILLPYLL